jgi:hypothetical protein
MELAEHAAAQGGVFTLAQALAHRSRAEVRRRVRSGDWVPQRHGIYATRKTVERAAEDARAVHMLACAARRLASGRDLVVSHQSAAVAQEIPLLADYTGAPQLLLPRPEGSRPRHVNGLFTAYLRADQRTGRVIPITTAARTVADCARVLPREDVLAMADAALRKGVSRAEALAVLETCRRWPGVQQAEELVRLADGRAESGLESMGRLWCHDAGLPPPDLQVRLCRTSDGKLLGRVDLVWLALRTVGELDGRLKYVVDEDGDRPDKVLWEEKLREDDLRDTGLEVARGYWSDRDDHGREFVERLRRAMARGAARTDEPRYRVLRET